MRKKSSWDQNAADKALHEIKAGKSIRRAAKENCMSEGILRYRIKKLEEGTGIIGSGRKPALPAECESHLAACIGTLCNLGFGPTVCDILDLAHDYVTANDIKTPFKNNRPGYEWLKSFMRRNKLSLKKAEMISAARKSSTSNPFVIYDFYEVITKIIEEKKLKESAIWNCGETSLQSDPSDLKAISQVGPTSGPGKENTTILAACSAAGRALDPLIIFKGKSLRSTWHGNKALPETMYSCSDTGRMNTEIFASWFERFASTVKERPLLLILEGHVTYVSLEVIELGISEGIMIVKIPPHTTDILQPLYLSCFAPLKKKWRTVLNNWFTTRGSRVAVRKAVLVNELCAIWRICLSESNVRSGFVRSGIFPVNEKKFPAARFDPVLLRRYHLWIAAGKPDNMKQDLALAPSAPRTLKEIGPGHSDEPSTSALPPVRIVQKSSTPLSVTKHGRPPGCICTSPPSPVPGYKWVIQWKLEPEGAPHTEKT